MFFILLYQQFKHRNDELFLTINLKKYNAKADLIIE